MFELWRSNLDPNGEAVLKYRTGDGTIVTCKLLITSMNWDQRRDVVKVGQEFIPGRQTLDVEFKGIVQSLTQKEESRILSGVRSLEI